MKKFTLVLAAALYAAGMFADDVKVGQLNPYAYDVDAKVRGTAISVTYYLNAPADSTQIAIYCDGTEVGTQSIAESNPGMHNAIVNLANFAQAGTYTIGIRVFKESYDKPFQLKEVKEGAKDTTALFYGFDHPKGVDVDVNPFSPHFGRLLAVESLLDLNPKWYSEGKPGIYAFDATFSPISNGNDKGFYGDYTYSAIMNMQTAAATPQAITAYAPYRLRISKDGRIFITTQDDHATSLYEVSEDLLTWTPIFTGSYNQRGEIIDANGNYITGINCGLELKGEGADLEIIMLNGNQDSYTSFSGKDYVVASYKIGTATAWTGAATTADSLSHFIGEAAVPVMGNAGIACDDNGGFWFHSARSDMIPQRGLCHVSAAGAVDFEFHATAADSAKYHILPNGSNGGAGCRIIKLDGNDVLFVGMGRRATDGTGRMVAYKVIYKADGTVDDLEILYDEHFIGISTNLNDFAVDFANNLFVVGNSNEKLIPVALPYSGVVETPVAAEVQKETALDDVEGEVKVQKVIENGQVIIIKNGVRYNTLGAVIK